MAGPPHEFAARATRMDPARHPAHGAPETGGRVGPRLDAAGRVRGGAGADLWVDATKLNLFDQDSGESLTSG